MEVAQNPGQMRSPRTIQGDSARRHRPSFCDATMVGAVLLAMLAAEALWAQTGEAGAGPSEQPLRAAPGPGQSELNSAAAWRAAEMLAAVGLHLDRDTAASPSQLEAGIALVRKALELAPENESVWRVALLVSAMQDPAHPLASSWRTEIISRLQQMDPSSSVLQLARLTDWVDQAFTAEARVSRLEALTAPGRIETMPAAVAANLLWDLSRLQLQRGDGASSEDALRRAVEVDEVMPAATAALAGLAMERLDDREAQAVFLIYAITANPADLTAVRALGALLLSERAYAPAARILAMIVGVSERDPFGGITGAEHAVADLAIARAGAGDIEGARTAISQYKAALSRMYREALVRAGSVSRVEAASREAPLPEVLIAIDALLAREEGDESAALTAESAVEEMLLRSDARRKDQKMPDGLKRLADVETAYALLGLGADPARARRILEPWQGSLTPEASATLAGLEALRAGQHEAALAALATAGNDPIVPLAQGEALLALGRPSEAARAWRVAAESGGGTLIGVLAQLRVAKLKDEAPITPTPLAAALARRVAELPTAVDRLLTFGEAAVDVTIEAPSAVIPAFELPRFKVRITNRTALRLSVSDVGPLDPVISITWEAGALHQPHAIYSTAPIISPIEDTLLLAPRESAVVDVNPLTMTELLFISNAYAGSGLTVRLRAVINPKAVPPRSGEQSGGITALPGTLGASRESNLFTLGKFNDSSHWLEDTLASIRHPDAPEDLSACAVLGARIAALAPGLDAPNQPSEADKAEAAYLAQGLAEAWPQLPPLARAYLILVSPRTQSSALEAVYAVSKADPDPLVRACYVLRRVDDSQDPFLLECAQSSDPLLALIARAEVYVLVRRAVQAGASGSGGG